MMVEEGSGRDLEYADSAGSGEGVTYYHEIDSTLYTATSSTFFGEIYGMFGMVNVADEADPDGAAFGYPQLSSEYVVVADPDIIFLYQHPLRRECGNSVGTTRLGRDDRGADVGTSLNSTPMLLRDGAHASSTSLNRSRML